VSSRDGDIVRRIWARDASLWTSSGEERWLGWLDEPARMRAEAAELVGWADETMDGFEDVVLLGMGGSSLAPEVLRRTFDAERFHVLDTTHPQAIRTLEAQLDLERTLFVVSSKSGMTLETRSHADYFWEKTGRGEQFVAITDPGSELEQVARARGFRRVFAGNPEIGGRYSALSPFGVVPAVLMGLELEPLLARAEESVEACRSERDDNPGLELGLALGHNWRHARNKVCINPNPGEFGLWVEQLLAESTGKDGKGLVPCPGENPNGGRDRQPALVLVEESEDVASEFFRWEFATAVAGHLLGIDPFDQPNVQEAKDRTGAILESGEYAQLEPEHTPDALFAQAEPGDYVCLQAFVEPSEDADAVLFDLARRAREETGCVVTSGYGPRYLHSTGQLHKGGPATGLFLQIVDDTGEELPIPGQPFGFGRLICAQAAGDYASLKERGRRVARVRLEDV
jgi:transaldolase / glucose-6-phosphate isomerase